MPALDANGLRLEYETFGSGEPIVLIMGLGAQLLLWDENLCRDLASRGFQVIRFDNRDIGKSTWLDHLGKPDVRRALLRAATKRRVESPYTLSDMSDDVIGLLDALGLDRAHVVGASMGGMIAQTLAIEHADRLMSMTSIMSGPGGLRYMLGRPYALRALLGKPPRTRDEAMEASVRIFQTIGGDYPLEEERLRQRAGACWDRGTHPAGFARQFTAILASGSRLGALRSVRIPSLIIHGTRDPLVPPRAGAATARAIPDATMLWIEGMGHFLPRPMWPRMLNAIEALARSARGLGPSSGPNRVISSA